MLFHVCGECDMLHKAQVLCNWLHRAIWVVGTSGIFGLRRGFVDILLIPLLFMVLVPGHSWGFYFVWHLGSCIKVMFTAALVPDCIRKKERPYVPRTASLLRAPPVPSSSQKGHRHHRWTDCDDWSRDQAKHHNRSGTFSTRSPPDYHTDV